MAEIQIDNQFMGSSELVKKPDYGQCVADVAAIVDELAKSEKNLGEIAYNEIRQKFAEAEIFISENAFECFTPELAAVLSTLFERIERLKIIIAELTKKAG
jgi:hypothetical protein